MRTLKFREALSEGLTGGWVDIALATWTIRYAPHVYPKLLGITNFSVIKEIYAEAGIDIGTAGDPFSISKAMQQLEQLPHANS